MKRLILAIALLACTASQAPAQSLDELNIQFHGYVTQGFLYTTRNNILTTDSSDGSPAWTGAVVNVGVQPTPKLHMAVQARYYLLGNYGGKIVLDWAAADYKANEFFGIRVGKVKTPWGLFNETQDIDPSYLWALLPQSIYPTTSSNSILAHYGGVVYGSARLGSNLGKLEYRGWAGEGYYGADDGYFVGQAEAGYNLPNGIQGVMYGAALHWDTPMKGLKIGVSELKTDRWAAVYTANGGAIAGTYILSPNSQPNYFATYEKNKLTVAYEYSRNWGNELSRFTGIPDSYVRNDDRGWYGMATYKVTPKLSAGFYESQNSDRQAALSAGRYQKDFAFSGRYDVNESLYLKVEQHAIFGTGLGYDPNLNPDLQPNTRLTALKLGVSF